MRHTSTFHDAF